MWSFLINNLYLYLILIILNENNFELFLKIVFFFTGENSHIFIMERN